MANTEIQNHDTWTKETSSSGFNVIEKELSSPFQMANPTYSIVDYNYPSSPPQSPGYVQEPYTSGQNPVVLTAGVLHEAQIVQQYRQPESYCGTTILSCVVFWFCCFPLGLAAFVLAMMATGKAEFRDDYSAAEAKRLGKWSIWLSISGIICGIIIIVIAVTYNVYFN